MGEKYKSMDIPEKIYVRITHPVSDEYTEIIAFEQGEGVEYTRTDVIIERLDGYIREHFYCHCDLDYICSDDYCSMEELIDDFKNYIVTGSGKRVS